MKKMFFVLILSIVLILVSCSENNIANSDSGTENYTNSDNSNVDLNTDAIDSSFKNEYNSERDIKDNEFPFDNIVVERNGYDIVAAGKYYGNDFDNVKYYGSYYRIIDNYEDFSKFTSWGGKVDESLFCDNFILVLHSYKCAYDTYYTHSKYNELNGKGIYRGFGLDESGNLTIIECKSGNDRAVVGEDPIYIEDYETILPVETIETMYLVIPKTEMPKDIQLNGEILFYQKVIIDL